MTEEMLDYTVDESGSLNEAESFKMSTKRTLKLDFLQRLILSSKSPEQ